MTGTHAFASTPSVMMDLDPYRFPAAFLDDLQDETPTTTTDSLSGPCTLPAPASRPTDQLKPADRRRIELNAALTTAGIAPSPGDRDAIEALCTLDDTTHTALRRWLTHLDSAL
ncbi:hypothetical protein ACGF1Z_11710 [Streptomyces sp. NPDC048018]|uniref:hypothetical protein n=1 Tax=Streptomyces sp. NPDC048018 TaxID=3365499 RepID=UPI003721B840